MEESDREEGGKNFEGEKGYGLMWMDRGYEGGRLKVVG